MQPTGANLAQDPTNPSTIAQGVAATPVQPELEQEVAALIVEALNLEMAASEIDPEAPLFGEGLGLDSIDILEIAVVVAKRYGIEMHSEDAANAKTFASLRALARHVAQTRTR